jgi:hypothetical protein
VEGSPLPRDLDSKPTEASVRELFDWLADGRSGWGTQRSLDTIFIDLIRDAHAVEVQDFDNPERKNRLKPERMSLAEAARTVDVLYNLHSVMPRIGFQWFGTGTRNVAKSDQLEIAMGELIDQLNPPTDSPWGRQTKQLIALGREAGLYLSGSAYWSDKYPKKGDDEKETDFLKRTADWRRKAPVPILWRDLPAESTFPPSMGSLNDLALSVLKSTWYELSDIFSAEELSGAIPEKKGDWFQPVNLVIYANRKFVAYGVIADEEGHRVGVGPFAFEFGGEKNTKILRSIEHHMNRCPIRILAGKTGTAKVPGEYWKSVLHDVRFMIPQLDRRASEAATASYMSVLPWLKATLNPTDDDNIDAKITKLLQQDLVILENANPGEATAAENLEAIHIPPFGEQNANLIGLLRDTIRDQTGAHEALSGGALAASMPAWSLNQITEQAKSRLKELTTAIVAAHIDHAETLMAAIQAFGEPIVLMRGDEKGGTVTLKPDDLENWVPRLQGEFKIQAPTSKIAMIQTGIQAMVQIRQQQLPIDLFWIMENYLDIELPFEQFKHSEITRFLLSPEMANWRMKIMQEEADIEIAGDEGMSMEEFERGAAPQLAGAPGVNQTIRGSAARSAGRAGAPLSALPGGPKPTVVAP